MYEDLVAALNPAISTLLFTNTRNQSERWHQCLRFACPEMEDALALHHSAIDRSERESIEAAVKAFYPRNDYATWAKGLAHREGERKGRERGHHER